MLLTVSPYLTLVYCTTGMANLKKKVSPSLSHLQGDYHKEKNINCRPNNLCTDTKELYCGSLFEDSVQGGSNMTGTDLYVNKPHCAAAVRP